MNRYITFAGNSYYAAGGANDFFGSYKTKEEAMKTVKLAYKKGHFGWWNVLDVKTGQVVACDGFAQC